MKSWTSVFPFLQRGQKVFYWPHHVFAQSNHLSLCFQQKPLSLRLWQALRELAAHFTDGWGARKRRWGQLEPLWQTWQFLFVQVRECDCNMLLCWGQLWHVFVRPPLTLLDVQYWKWDFFFPKNAFVFQQSPSVPKKCGRKHKTHGDQLHFLSSSAISIPTMALLQICEEYLNIILKKKYLHFSPLLFL